MTVSPASGPVLAQATQLIADARQGKAAAPVVHAFFDEATNTVSYIVHGPGSQEAAIIDSVLDYNPASGSTSHASADAIIAHVQREGLKISWILETHAHADHLSAAPYLQEKLGGQIAIGHEITTVQSVFGTIFNLGEDFARNGSQFDHLFSDGDQFQIGTLSAMALHVPGHTPADLAYVIGDAIFVGDTLFMPDYGSARADFPGGNARTLYRSIRHLLSLPPETHLFMCHDYKAPGREEYRWETTIAAQRAYNVHIHDGVSEDDFVAMREARDKTLGMPTLILPAIQINIRGGHKPTPETNGTHYLKIPLDAL